MSPARLQRQRPEPQSHLVRRPEPIRTGDGPPPETGGQGAAADDAGRQAPPRPRRPRQTAKPDDASTANAARPRPRGRSARPSARDLIAPARVSIAREALKADVPAELELIQRLRRYRLDKGVDIRDQVAMAVDAWLTGEGY